MLVNHAPVGTPAVWHTALDSRSFSLSNSGSFVFLQRKEAGGFAVSMPITFKDGRTVAHSMQPRAEIDATIVRNGMGLNVVMHQMNAVLRLRQA